VNCTQIEKPADEAGKAWLIGREFSFAIVVFERIAFHRLKHEVNTKRLDKSQ
jgi:hypothetical protein